MRTKTTKAKRNTRSRKRAPNRFRLFLALCAGILIEVICIVLLLPSMLFGGGTRENPAALGVKSIAVTGNTRYDEDAILRVAQLQVGQSVFVLDRNGAADRIKKTFHYVEDVKVKVDLKQHVVIEITEAQPMGAVYAKGKWVTVSKEGIGLAAEPINSQRPLRQLYLKGAGVLSDRPGEQVLDAASMKLLGEIFDALSQTDLLTHISMVDIEKRGDIRLSWKNQITILLGNDTNLPFEIAAAASTIPKVLEKHGQTTTGVLNLTQHSDPNVESPAIFFTPGDLLDEDF